MLQCAESIEAAIQEASLQFGGLDIVVHSAGLAFSKPVEDTTEADWDLLQDVLVKGQFLLSRAAANIMRKQNLEGNIINIVSKNGLVSGPNNIGYGTAKAAQMHMSRLLATELAPDQIRVNTVNPDGVIIGSKIWEGDWAEGRAKAYGITVAELPEFYAKRNILNKIIRPEDIANGVFAFLAVLDKSTGNIINVDGEFLMHLLDKLYINYAKQRKIASFNESYLAAHKQNLNFLGENLSKKNLDLNTVISKLSDFQIAIPSWALGTGGTGFGRFPRGESPIRLRKKLKM